MHAVTTSPSRTTALSLPRFDDRDGRSALKILVRSAGPARPGHPRL